MTIKIDKQEAKKPDELLAGLTQGYNWAIGHRNSVIGLIGLFLLIGLGITGFQYVSDSKETKAQEQYYSIEKIYFEKKGQFEQANRQEQQKVNAQKDKNAKTKAEPTPENTQTKATGDLAKDYGSIETDLKDVFAKHPATQGAAMAALLLTDLYIEYKQPAQALDLLKNMKPQAGSMMDSLATMQLGNVYALNSDCQNAITTWAGLLQKKQLAYLHEELKLRTAQCQIQLGQTVEAEKSLAELASNKEAMNFTAQREAAKYLRLLRVKKNFNGEG